MIIERKKPLDYGSEIPVKKAPRNFLVLRRAIRLKPEARLLIDRNGWPIGESYEQRAVAAKAALQLRGRDDPWALRALSKAYAVKGGAVHDVHSVTFNNIAITTSAKTYLEISAAASPQDIVFYHAWVDFDGSASGTSALVELVRKSVACTGTASPPAATPLSGSSAGLSTTSGASIRWQATVEGTTSAILITRYVSPAGSIDLMQALGRDITLPGAAMIATRVTGATGVLPKAAHGFEWAE